MKKHFILTCLVLLCAFASFGLPVIYGTLGCCVGDSTNYLSVDSLTSGGGTWSSSNPAVATVAGSGYFRAVAYGVSPGTSTITYTVGGSSVTAVYTVSSAPAAITGTTTFCEGTTSTLSDATGGGTWSSDDYRVATVGSATGVVTGEAATSVNIYYTISPGCRAITYVTINETNVGYIIAPYTLCTGTSATLTEIVPGGTWSSSSAAIATVDVSTGVATGVSAGTVNFTYTVSGICGPAISRDTVIVSSTTTGVTVSGPSSVYPGASISLSTTGYGGTWGSSNTAVATVNSSGVVTGVSLGTAAIGYTVTGCSGAVTGTTNVTVTPIDGISGRVILGSSYGGPAMVWLITYNPATLDLEAIDSTVIDMRGDSSVYYQFTGIATDSYRVKATITFDTSSDPTGYIPTYHTSSFFWHDADVIYHVSGTSDINKDINMGAGSAVSGPGFIGGSVMTGANRGTSTSIPVPNLLVYAINSATGAIIQQAYTNTSGAYSFSGLPLGTYLVHPELINYATTPYTSITLSSGSASMLSASFIQHTVSHTITPGTTGVNNVLPEVSAVVAYPNPASDKLNIVWNETTGETGNVNLADITGKEVYKTTISMKAGAGTTQLHLPELTNGLYILTIKSANINYSNKIQIQH